MLQRRGGDELKMKLSHQGRKEEGGGQRRELWLGREGIEVDPRGGGADRQTKGGPPGIELPGGVPPTHPPPPPTGDQIRCMTTQSPNPTHPWQPYKPKARR